MENHMNDLVNWQQDIAEGNVEPPDLPKFNRYAVCNLRGGIGKTSLAFNLAHCAGDLLSVDTCPQGNLSYFFDNQYFANTMSTVLDLIYPYILPGMGKPTHLARHVAATNSFFNRRNVFYIPSSEQLYTLPGMLATAINQAKSIPGQQQVQALDAIFYGLRDEIEREMRELGISRCIVDTSPFFSGATHLTCYAVEALIVPVRTDQQSMNSLQLLLETLSNPSSEFRRVAASDGHTPKIQMVVLTHGGWATRPGARNEPNQQTKLYLQKVREIIWRYISHFTTDHPDNHILLLNDFLGSGRISTALSKPIHCLYPGDSMRINRVKVTVNEAVEKIKRQLSYLSRSIWS